MINNDGERRNEKQKRNEMVRHNNQEILIENEPFVPEPLTKEQIFMQYACANCDRIFLDKDVKGRMTIIKGNYCPECQALGFKNPEVRLKKKLSAKQQEVLKRNQFGVRKNSPKSNQKTAEGRKGLGL